MKALNIIKFLRSKLNGYVPACVGKQNKDYKKNRYNCLFFSFKKVAVTQCFSKNEVVILKLLDK